MKTIEMDIECQSCGGTGLYVGMAEKAGAAVVCHSCKGTGKYHYTFKYEEFTGRKEKKGVKHVIQTNPGIGIGQGNGFKFEDFGGMSYDDWKSGKKFKDGMEMRKYTCPAWWYQSADYSRKPNWKECPGFGSFSDCPYFKTKDKCWARFDDPKTATKELLKGN